MDENTSDNRYGSSKSTTILQNSSEDEEFEGDNEGDPALWSVFSQNFQQVQAVLDCNRVLIQQVNENHQSKIHDNMVRNVALIQEINENISKVTSLYSDLSANLLSVCQQRGGDGNGKEKKRNTDDISS